MSRDPNAGEVTGDVLGTIWLNKQTSDYWSLVNLTPYQWQYQANLRGPAGPSGPAQGIDVQLRQYVQRIMAVLDPGGPPPPPP